MFVFLSIDRFQLSFRSFLGNPERISAQIAQQLRVAAQRDFKDRSIRKANLMQARYENEIQELISKQQWYQKNQIGMSKEDELEYQRLCQEAQFRLHILEERLKRYVEIFSLKIHIFSFEILDIKKWQQRNTCNWKVN